MVLALGTCWSNQYGPKAGKFGDPWTRVLKPLSLRMIMVLNATVDCCSVYVVQILFCYTLLNILLHYLVQNIFCTIFLL